MYLQQIRIPAAVLALMAAASCTSTVDEPPMADAAAVSFTAGNASRSLIENDADLQNSEAGFAVWGEYYETSKPDAMRAKVFDAKRVAYTGGAWAYDDVQYWFPGMTYSFAALFPAGVKGATYGGGTQVALVGYDVLKSKGVDLLGSMAVRECRVGVSQTPVAFGFRHLLSQLNFVAKVNASVQSGVVIESAVLYGIPSSGNWSGYGEDARSAWTALASSETSASAPLAHAASVTVLPTDTGGKALFGGDNVLLCIPQAVPDKAVFEVRYHYADTPDVPRTYTFNLKLASGMLTNGWEPGGSYRYTFEIGSDDFILFTKPEVVEWEEKSGSNIIIQGDETN